jgi:hypothetical protein
MNRSDISGFEKAGRTLNTGGWKERDVLERLNAAVSWLSSVCRRHAAENSSIGSRAVNFQVGQMVDWEVGAAAA